MKYGGGHNLDTIEILPVGNIQHLESSTLRPMDLTTGPAKLVLTINVISFENSTSDYLEN